MKTEKVKIEKVRLSANNPRVIKNDKFKKLVKSIKDFPDMLKLRPIVVDETMTVLGGNMRLRACLEAGLKEVYIIKASDFTEEQKKEFVIKDNSSFGEWDWDLLANEWNIDELDAWGLDLPKVYFEEDNEPEFDEDELAMNLDSYINGAIKQVVLYYPQEDYEKLIDSFEQLRNKLEVENNAELVKLLVNEKL